MNDSDTTNDIGQGRDSSSVAPITPQSCELQNGKVHSSFDNNLEEVLEYFHGCCCWIHHAILIVLIILIFRIIFEFLSHRKNGANYRHQSDCLIIQSQRNIIYVIKTSAELVGHPRLSPRHLCCYARYFLLAFLDLYHLYFPFIIQNDNTIRRWNRNGWIILPVLAALKVVHAGNAKFVSHISLISYMFSLSPQSRRDICRRPSPVNIV